MKIKPLHDWAVIRPKDAAEQTAGGILIPDTAKEEPAEGEVLAIGTGKFVEEKDKKGRVKEKKFVQTVLKPGDHILYEKYAATKVNINNEELLMVREENILGLL
jgi:chaperonin GroES